MQLWGIEYQERGNAEENRRSLDASFLVLRTLPSSRPMSITTTSIQGSSMHVVKQIQVSCLLYFHQCNDNFEMATVAQEPTLAIDKRRTE